VPNTNKTGANHPDFRMLSQGYEAGVGWVRTGEGQGEYVSFERRSPEVGATRSTPISVAPGQSTNDAYAIVWNPADCWFPRPRHDARTRQELRLTQPALPKRWVRYVEGELRRERSTWGKYEQRLKDHITPAVIARPRNGEKIRFGDLAIDETTAPDVEALKDHLLSTLSSDLAGKCLSVLRMMFNDVVRRGERESNPAQTVRVRKAKRGEDEVDIPQIDEMRAIVSAVEVLPPAPPTFQEVWVKRRSSAAYGLARTAGLPSRIWFSMAQIPVFPFAAVPINGMLLAP
jgi:uncharacterized protein (DUF736 family)